MEYEMKLSPAAVRDLRLSRGWSQDQLAIVSGISLRTVQRVEAEGFASINTAVSLASTFEVQLFELQEIPIQPVQETVKAQYGQLLLGISILALSGISESGRISTVPMTGFFAAINILCGLIGAVLAAPVLVGLWRSRKYFGVALLLLGVPLVTLLALGGVFTFVSGRIPNWNVVIFGLSGAVFVAIAMKDLRRRKDGAVA